MKGWKTWVGIIGLVMTKVSTTYLGVDLGEVETDADKIFLVIQSIFGALTLVGFGHKIEKGKI